MTQFTFAILMSVCVLLAGGIYAGKVMSDVQRTESVAAEALDLADRAVSAAKDAVGDETFRSQDKAVAAARTEVQKLESFYADLNARAFDYWFTPLNTAWSAEPDPETFKRFYNLAVDQLFREIDEDVGPKKLAETARQLIDHPFMHDATLPDAKDMRALQREFWIEDRVIRAFARAGAVLARPLRGGEVQAGVGPRAGQARFDRIRYDVQVLCREPDLARVLHTLESPFEVVHEDGHRETIVCPVIIDNVAIRAMTVDAQTTARYAGAPPVEVTFFFSVIDFHPVKH